MCSAQYTNIRIRIWKGANIERKCIEIYQGVSTLEVGGGVKILYHSMACDASRTVKSQAEAHDGLPRE